MKFIFEYLFIYFVHCKCIVQKLTNPNKATTHVDSTCKSIGRESCESVNMVYTITPQNILEKQKETKRCLWKELLIAVLELDQSVWHVMFSARLIEPSDHHRWSPVGLMSDTEPCKI
ncbi:hypothetical protein SFRURICE_017963 [Spodoptera frugiperda]|nr:hypothetical protein SFRURICE_017963 [Spodoptera frugiperda]